MSSFPVPGFENGCEISLVIMRSVYLYVGVKISIEWLRLTADQFEKARELSGGVCILPIGVLERHGSHLPLGTDVFEADALARATAEKEYAVVLPPLPYSIDDSSTNCLGAIDLRPRVLLDLIENLLDEVARNGFRKIMLFNFHGGNRALLPLILAEHKNRKEADYDLYLPDPPPYDNKALEAVLESSSDYHAGEMETSLIQYIAPETVDQGSFPTYATVSTKDYPIAGAQTSVDWVASFPDHYAGDATKASSEKGARIFELITTRMAELVKTIKSDTVTSQIRKEFQRRRLNPPAR